MGQICKCMSCGNEHELDDQDMDDENLREFMTEEEIEELTDAENKFWDRAAWRDTRP